MTSRSSSIAPGRAAAAALFGLLAVTTNLALAEEVPTPSPTFSYEPITTKTACDPNIKVSIRYSGNSQRLYVESADNESGGCVTLKEIWRFRDGNGPLYAVEKESGEVSDLATGTWLLTEDLYVQDGHTLQVYGLDEKGDANELRLLSTNGTAATIDASDGQVDIVGTKVVITDVMPGV